MTKKYRNLIGVICVSMFLFILVGCRDGKNKTSSLESIVNLSTSDISRIKISEGGGMQVEIEDSKQIEKVCSFLAKIHLSQEYVEEKYDSDSSGGFGSYFLITYSNNTSSHIQVYKDYNQIKISGVTNDGSIENKWRVYTISDTSSIMELEEIVFSSSN